MCLLVDSKAVRFLVAPNALVILIIWFCRIPGEQIAPLGRITMRRMFGKTGVFCDGFMFGMVSDNPLYPRVDDHNRAAFKEAE